MKPNCCKNKSSLKKLSEIEEFLKVISEKNRLKILCILKKKEKCVCDIYEYLELSQNLVSHHLKVLKELNLISSRQKGRKVFYKLNHKKIEKHIEILNKFIK